MELDKDLRSIQEARELARAGGEARKFGKALLKNR